MNSMMAVGICLLIIFSCSNLVFAQSSSNIQSSNTNSQYVNQFQQLQDQSWGQTHPIDYAVFFVTSKATCSDSDYQSLKFYKIIADEYLSLYQIQHNQIGGLCVSSGEFKQDFSSLSSATLPIVIMDKTASTQLLTQQNYLGLYYFPDLSGKQSILVCACDNNIESWTGAWVLSHELSHFSLNYYGMPQTISVSWVHYIQNLEYGCQQGNFNKVCPDYSTSVTSPSGNQIPVMEIYGQGPTSYNMPTNAPQSEITISIQDISQLPIQSTAASGTVSIDKSKIILDQSHPSQTITISGTLQSYAVSFVDLAITDSSNKVVQKLELSVNNGKYDFPLTIAKSFSSGQYKIVVTNPTYTQTSKGQNSYVSSTSFEVINEVSTPEFSFALPILIISISLVVMLSTKISTRLAVRNFF